jgi:hypothetical protein
VKTGDKTENRRGACQLVGIASFGEVMAADGQPLLLESKFLVVNFD